MGYQGYGEVEKYKMVRIKEQFHTELSKVRDEFNKESPYWNSISYGDTIGRLIKEHNEATGKPKRGRPKGSKDKVPRKRRGKE